MSGASGFDPRTIGPSAWRDQLTGGVRRLAGRRSWPWLEVTRSFATVVLIRHADVAGGGDDPGLSAAGQARAQELRHVLADLPIAAIFVSSTQRTKQTASPLATKLGIAPTPMGNAFGPVGPIEDAIRALDASSVALVVGHTATVPQLIAELDGPPNVPIGQTEFDRLFVLCSGRLITLRYGAGGS